MAHPFEELRKNMSPESQRRAEEGTARMKIGVQARELESAIQVSSSHEANVQRLVAFASRVRAEALQDAARILSEGGYQDASLLVEALAHAAKAPSKPAEEPQ